MSQHQTWYSTEWRSPLHRQQVIHHELGHRMAASTVQQRAQGDGAAGRV